MVFPLYKENTSYAPIGDFDPINHIFKRIAGTSPDIVHLIQEKVPALAKFLQLGAEQQAIYQVEIVVITP
jgi:hypothetical protein